jgi:hypothetical protein
MVSVEVKFLLTDAIWKRVVGVQPPPVTVRAGRPSRVMTTTPDSPAISGMQPTLAIRGRSAADPAGVRTAA